MTNKKNEPTWGPVATPSPVDEDMQVLFDNTTRQVTVPKDKSITEYLHDKGLERGVDLEADTENVDEIEIRVESGRNKYELKGVLAEGGMGLVYKARDRNCRRNVAMKVLPVDQQGDSESLVRFIEEAQITSQLEHPNIVPVHEMALDGEGNIFYTMKYVAGVTLTEILLDIRKGKQEVIDQYPLPRLLTIFQKVCDAVAFAHSKNVVHRDLKPDNIMIGSFGEVLLMDWGLAKVVAAQRASASRQAAMEFAVDHKTEAFVVDTGPDMEDEEDCGIREQDIIDSIRSDDTGTDLRTISGRVMGTPGFMAPEQASPYGPGITTQADVYSLGAILYSILVLRPPVTGMDVKSLLKRIREGDIVPPVAYNKPVKTADGKIKSIKLPHLPDKAVPRALSDITVKALETNPEDRYLTVQDLQHDIEAYQQGRIWHMILDEDFSNPQALLDNWEIIGGQYEFKNGEFRLYGGEPQLLLLKRQLPGDIRIEFECRQDSVYLNDVGCFMSGILSENRKWVSASGYEFKYGGYDNSMNVLMRSDQTIWSQMASPLKQNELYRVCAERVGPHMRFVVNNREVFDLTDADPLSGSDRTAIGILGWIASTWFKRIRVYSLATPRKSDILDVAYRQLQKGHYRTSRDLFEEVIDSFPDEARKERALQGYETACRRENLETNLRVWQERIEAAWPGLGKRLRMDNNGLTMDLTNLGVADLTPIQGMPLTCLYCACNNIASLEPIRGMDLLKLDCSGNPIRDMEPLRGMPLTTLVCECCHIETLKPLADLPLTLLNCGGNKLVDGLEPLRTIPITWLSCWGNHIKTLEPLRGKHLTALYCDDNDIDSLSVLKDMPLHTLHCGGNRITSLESLRGLDLRSLHCAHNRISDLTPLEGMKLSMFSCHCNEVVSLRPLDHMPLGALVCSNNRLTSLEPFVKNPPVGFQYDCETLTSEDLEWLSGIWGWETELKDQVHNVEVLIATRRNDVSALRKLAMEYNGHKYLFIPKYMPWEDARDYCETLGGHLAVIPDRRTNDFISSMFPHGSWCWIGLYTHEEGRQEWVTRMPFDFDSFVDPLRGRLPGPKLFFSGLWTRDTMSTAQNGFIIEWDV
ncbi:MAG: hypothetical protein EOM20_01360 [Spartobacteria bacterium]|nr:hypothetical protein [Spartobacteria bacterium]